jgi:outer membrane protein OmpA-like peptidoglycan-associated protein
MPSFYRRLLRVVFPAILLLSCTLQANESVDQPEFTLSYGRQLLQLTITSVSPEHEEAILQVLREQFDGIKTRVEFTSALPVGSDWPAISAQLLLLVAATDSAQASIQNGMVKVRGTSADMKNFNQRLKTLREALPESMTLDADVLAVTPVVATAELCAMSFAAIASQTIHFPQTSTRVRDSAIPILDRLIEFAYDCQNATIAIIGHTDATGDESWNKQVSLARAQAAADYVIENGIEPDRLVLEGAGSQYPLGDNSTVAGRERNRRIEFELR